MDSVVYLIKTGQFLCQDWDDKTLRKQLTSQGIDARRMSRFIQLALLGALPLKEHLRANTAIYLGSGFSSPSKFNKMFRQLNEENIPSPLDFMANLNNAATFQVAQSLNVSGNSVFLAINQHTFLQPLKLALLDLQLRQCENALVGWAFERYQAEQQEGSCWWLLSHNAQGALATIPCDLQKQPENRPHFLQQIIDLQAEILNGQQIVL